MSISIYRWADGPYVLFDDRDSRRRYVLDGCRARTLVDRLQSHVDSSPDRSLVIEQRVTRDPNRDLTVTDIYVQDCDDLFEVMTATGPMLSLSPTEAGTLLLLAVATSVESELPQPWNLPELLPPSLPLEAPVDIAAAKASLGLAIWALPPAAIARPESGAA